MISKKEVVSLLEERFSKCSIAIVTSYQGIPVTEMNRLRRKLRESGIEYRVAKNTLTRLAANNAGKAELEKVLQGSSAIAFGYGDPTDIARVLTEYIQSSKSLLAIKGGIANRQFLMPQDINTMARLPSREILISMVLQEMQKPILALLSIQGSVLSNFIGTIEARREQLASQEK